jgi:hypothetical protein
MPVDPRELLRHAQECLELADDERDKISRNMLINIARGCLHAAELVRLEQLKRSQTAAS